MTTIELAEYERTTGLELTVRAVHALRQLSCIDVSPDRTLAGRWELQAQHWVGAIACGGMELRVRPKVPVRRLFALMSEAANLPEWSDDEIAWGADAGLLDIMARVLCHHAERLVASGLMQGYRTVEESLPALRGRVLVGAQLSRRAGLPLPLEVTYDDYTIDVLENRLVAGAVDLMLRFALPTEISRRLRRLRQAFDGVSPTRASSSFPAVQFTRLNDRYRAAVGIARLILHSGSLEAVGARSTAGLGVLVDMNRLYERAVGVRLQRALGAIGGTAQLQWTGRLDDEGHLDFRPDLVWTDGPVHRAVVDFKYKRADEHVAQADVYQAITYAVRCGLDRAHLVYPSPPPFDCLGIGSVEVRLHQIALDGSADELDDAVRSLADLLAR